MGGPEPQEIRDLTVIERRVIQLARVYAMVKRVLGKHVPWAKDPRAMWWLILTTQASSCG